MWDPNEMTNDDIDDVKIVLHDELGIQTPRKEIDRRFNLGPR